MSSIITDKELVDLDITFNEGNLTLTKDQFLQILRRIRLSESVLHEADRLAFLVEDQPDYRAEAFKLQDQIAHYWYVIDPDEPDLDYKEDML